MSGNGGPAYPVKYQDGAGGYEQADGISIRDYFAAAALQGILSSPDGGPDDWQRVADAAYYAADAMLAARERKEACNGSV